jgi:hypothetical protein
LVGFVFSFAVTVAMTVALYLYGRRRPKGTPVSWGEAMAGATYVFFLMFLAYGIVPHQWLAWADNELGWRSDKFFVGIGGIFGTDSGLHLPFTITYQVLRDLIVVGIYGLFLTVHIVLWSVWQNRDTKRGLVEWSYSLVGRERSPATTAYGRPLVKRS